MQYTIPYTSALHPMRVNLKSDLPKSVLSMGGAAIFGLALKENPNYYLRLDWTGETMDESFVIVSSDATMFDQAALSELLKNDHYTMLEPVQLKAKLFEAA